MWLFRALCGACFLIAVCACSPESPKPTPTAPGVPAPSTSAEFLAAVRASVARDALSEGLELAEEGRRRFPDQLELGIEQAKLLTLLNREAESLALIRTLPQTDPAVLEFHGYAELLQGNIAAARPLLERAVAATTVTPGATPHPVAAMARYRLGLLLLRSGELPAALESFNAALRINPGLVEASYHAMSAAQRLGDRAAEASARDHFRDVYESRLIQQNAFIDPVYDERRGIDRSQNLEWRPAVASTSFEREFPAGSGVEFACRVPAGDDVVFSVTIVDGPGKGQTLLAGLYRAAPGLTAPWIPHLVELPAGAAGARTRVRFEVLPGSRLGRLLRRAPAAEAAFSEPGAVSPIQNAAKSTRPNVLLISLDTLRADKLGCYGGRSGVSPAIDRLAAEGTRFARLESASNWTLPAHYSMMTGLTPAAHGINPSPDKTRGYVNPGDKVAIRGSGRELMLAEALAEAGYRTAAVTENAWVTGRFGFDQGFRYYRNANAFGLPATRFAALSDLEQFATRGPWMMFLHTYATHQPYHAPKAFRTRYADPEQIGFSWPSARVPVSDYRRLHNAVFPTAPSDRVAFSALYDGQISWADTMIDAVIGLLERKGVLQNTIIVITSDHGEELFERGGFDHGDTLYEEATHVPLIVHAPGLVPAGRVIDTTVGLVDVPATILDLAGLSATHGSGRSLRPMWQGGGTARPVFAEAIGRGSEALAACWDGALKYIRRDTSSGRHEWLFDLASDPGEQRDLTANRKADLARLRALYDAHAATAAQVAKTLGAGEEALTEEDLARLRSLGYVQ
ncbi:MAG: sulfatase-like hydrolase/transferase [Acidobacteriota bacterium]